MNTIHSPVSGTPLTPTVGQYISSLKHPIKIEFWFRRKHRQSEQGTIRALLTLDQQSVGPISTRIPANYSVWERRRTDSDDEEVQSLMNLLNTFEARLKKAYDHLINQQVEITLDQVIAYAQKYQAAESKLQFQLSVSKSPEDSQRAYERFAVEIKVQSGTLRQTPLGQVYKEYYDYQRQQVNDDNATRHIEQISTSTLQSYPKRWRFVNAYLNHLKKGVLMVSTVKALYMGLPP